MQAYSKACASDSSDPRAAFDASPNLPQSAPSSSWLKLAQCQLLAAFVAMFMTFLLSGGHAAVAVTKHSH